MAANGIMAGKRGLIMGVANDRSIAWGIAQSLASQGAELAFTYLGEAFRKRVAPLVEPLKPAALLDCDVSTPASLDAAFAGVDAILLPTAPTTATTRRSRSTWTRTLRTSGSSSTAAAPSSTCAREPATRSRAARSIG